MRLLTSLQRVFSTNTWWFLIAYGMSTLACHGQQSGRMDDNTLKILWLGSSSTSDELIRCTDQMLTRSGSFEVESTKGAGYVRVDLIARNGDFEPVGFKQIRDGEYDFVVLQVSAGVLLNPPDNRTGRVGHRTDLRCSFRRRCGSCPIRAFCTA